MSAFRDLVDRLIQDRLDQRMDEAVQVELITGRGDGGPLGALDAIGFGDDDTPIIRRDAGMATLSFDLALTPSAMEFMRRMVGLPESTARERVEEATRVLEQYGPPEGPQPCRATIVVSADSTGTVTCCREAGHPGPHAKALDPGPVHNEDQIDALCYAWRAGGRGWGRGDTHYDHLHAAMERMRWEAGGVVAPVSIWANPALILSREEARRRAHDYLERNRWEREYMQRPELAAEQCPHEFREHRQAVDGGDLIHRCTREAGHPGACAGRDFMWSTGGHMPIQGRAVDILIVDDPVVEPGPYRVGVRPGGDMPDPLEGEEIHGYLERVGEWYQSTRGRDEHYNHVHAPTEDEMLDRYRPPPSEIRTYPEASDDTQRYDSTPDNCWSCDFRESTTRIGLCAGCAVRLKAPGAEK